MNIPMVSCIITSWKKDPPENAINQMLNQTYQHKQLLVFSSDLDLKDLKKKYSNCEFFDVPNRKDWGHAKRAMGLAFAEGKYMCFVNADDEYDPLFLEYLITALEKEEGQLAYCDWADKSIDFNTALAFLAKGQMTSGNFVVRSDIAKKVGWQHRLYASDWYFIRDLIGEGVQTVYLNYNLMKHK